MMASQQEIFAVLRQYNPWWGGAGVPDLPKWKRAAFAELKRWLSDPPVHRAVLVTGARQVGKTTLLLQAVESLLSEGAKPEQILYATFDHPLLKLVGLAGVLKVWREVQPSLGGTEFLLLDELQHVEGWGTWVKHQVDFEKNQRIALTGSAIPLSEESPESGVGRWHTIKLPTLSFCEYLQIKRIAIPDLPDISSLTGLFDWTPNERVRVGEIAKPLVAHFHEYLLRGGFPQTAQVDSISLAQKLLREDIVDKALRRDMTAHFGVRRVLALERVFLYFCLHDGTILDVPALSRELGVVKQTVNDYVELLESAHLVYKLKPYGYGKQVLRGRHKVYLADAAIAGSVLLKGKELIEDSTRLGVAVETAFFKHVFARYYQTSIGFSYWRGKGGLEVDIVAEVRGEVVPFEVKYGQSAVRLADVKGLQLFCKERNVSRGYVITREMTDFALLPFEMPKPRARKAPQTQGLLKIPAPLACYWLSKPEIGSTT